MIALRGPGNLVWCPSGCLAQLKAENLCRTIAREARGRATGGEDKQEEPNENYKGKEQFNTGNTKARRERRSRI